MPNGDEGTFGEAGPGSDVYRFDAGLRICQGMVNKSGGIGLSDQIYFPNCLKMQEG